MVEKKRIEGVASQQYRWAQNAPANGGVSGVDPNSVHHGKIYLKRSANY
jgi:hypothetical protein